MLSQSIKIDFMFFMQTVRSQLVNDVFVVEKVNMLSFSGTKMKFSRMRPPIRDPLLDFRRNIFSKLRFPL